jgi:hypothetical protein
VTAFEVARGVRLGRFRCVVEHDVTLASGPGRVRISEHQLVIVH